MFKFSQTISRHAERKTFFSLHSTFQEASKKFGNLKNNQQTFKWFTNKNVDVLIC
jgi:hypothetical protein